MVRLRREIEGIRVDRAVPLPPWTDDERASSALTPAFDAEICAYDAQRVLLAGAPRLDLAIRLAETGRFVTICDLPSASIAAAHARLAPTVASHLQLVDKPYGQAAFAPSSYDLVVFCDALDIYDEPEWVAHKFARELKVDAILLARLWTVGPLPELDDGIVTASTDAKAPPAWCLPLVRGVARPPWPAAALDPLGADAVDRGAWSLGLQPRHDAATQLDAIDSRLRVESIVETGGDRAALAAWAAHGRGPVGRLARHVLEADAREAAALRSKDERRIVTLRARRALGDRRLMAGRAR